MTVNLDRLSDNAVLEETAVPRPQPTRARRPYGWWLAGSVLVLLLGLLGIAEISWLHQLPQDHATRITLIALPTAPAPNTGAAAPEWRDRLLDQATDEQLLQAVIGNLDLRDAQTGERLTPEALAASMRVGAECIDQRLGQEPPRRGLLLYAAVRGTGAADTEAIAQEWSARFVERSQATFPGLTIQPAAALGVPYEICQ